MVTAQATVQLAEKALPLAKSALGFAQKALGSLKLLPALKADIIPVLEEGAEALSKGAQTVSDGGTAKSLFDASELLKDLKGLIQSPSGELAGEHVDGLQKIINHIETSELAINEENKKSLEELLNNIIHPNSTPTQNSSASHTTQNPQDIEAEIQRRVEEKIKGLEAQRQRSHEHLDPLDKITMGIGGIVTGEFRNMNSEVGWAMKAFCKWKGITLNEEVVSNYLRSFADDKFKKNLETYIKGKVSGHNDPLSLCEGLTENDKLSLPWVGTLISIGGSTPAWVFDSVAMLGSIVDYGAEMLHWVPGLGKILRMPMGRKLITGIGQFSGRFAKDIELIGKGARELRAGMQEAAPAVNPQAQVALTGAK